MARRAIVAAERLLSTVTGERLVTRPTNIFLDSSGLTESFTGLLHAPCGLLSFTAASHRAQNTSTQKVKSRSRHN